LNSSANVTRSNTLSGQAAVVATKDKEIAEKDAELEGLLEELSDLRQKLGRRPKKELSLQLTQQTTEFERVLEKALGKIPAVSVAQVEAAAKRGASSAKCVAVVDSKQNITTKDFAAIHAREDVHRVAAAKVEKATRNQHHELVMLMAGAKRKRRRSPSSSSSSSSASSTASSRSASPDSSSSDSERERKKHKEPRKKHKKSRKKHKKSKKSKKAK